LLPDLLPLPPLWLLPLLVISGNKLVLSAIAGVTLATALALSLSLYGSHLVPLHGHDGRWCQLFGLLASPVTGQLRTRSLSLLLSLARVSGA